MADENPSTSGEGGSGHQVVVADQHGIGQASKSGVELLKVFTDWLVTPRAILAKAKAEAEAHKITIRAQTEAQIDRFDAIEAKRLELVERSQRRVSHQAIQEQANLEKVLEDAVPLLDDKKAEPSKIAPDWRTAFVRHATAVSDAEVQSLWSKILAGEANKPGSFSQRTMTLIADISKDEAELFEMICRYRTSIGLIVYNYDDPIYKSNGLDFGAVMTLKTTGLIDTMDSLAEYALGGFGDRAAIFYHGHGIFIPKPPTNFAVGKVALTSAGKQMANVCRPLPVEGFSDWLLKRWYPLGAYEMLAPEHGQQQMCHRVKPDGSIEIVPVPEGAPVGVPIDQNARIQQ